MHRFFRFGVGSLGLVLAIIFFTVVTPDAKAQTSNGYIGGKIADKSGATVPKASVTATNATRGGQPRSTETDSGGTYRIEELSPGAYIVTVKAAGFSELKISGVEVKASQGTTVDGTLELASQSATVLVEASTGQELQTQSGEISGSITEKEITSLPFLSLNPASLALTMAGVSAPPGLADFTNGVGLSVNGTRPRANNFLIDGQDDNDNAINGQAFQPSNVEALSEVAILTSAFSAEYGRGGGANVNYITKGGTNTWHGSLFEFHRNSALAAIPFDSGLQGVTSNPRDIENIFGFTIGGPVIHNKLFVFGSTQWDRDHSVANGSTITLPTAAGVATLQSVLPTLSAGGQANVNFLLASMGGLVGTTPSGPGGTFNTIALGAGRPAVQVGTTQRSGVTEQAHDRNEWVRVDWNATEHDTVSSRYIRDDSTLTPDFFNFPGSLPPYDSQQGGPSQTFGVTWTHTFNTKVLNQFRASYTNIGFTFGPTPATAANPLVTHASYSISGSGIQSLGFNGALPQGRAHKTYQYQDVISLSYGKHTIRGGGEISHLSVVDAIPFNSRGSIGFNSGGTFTGLGNFVDNFTGQSGSVAQVFGNPVLQPFVTTYSPYVEDTWRMRSNLTVTLGLRYEYWGTVENSLQFPAMNGALPIGIPGATFPGSFASKQTSDRNNFAPRFGFAYSPQWGGFITRKTVIRGGYGIFYDGLFTNILDNTGAAQPNAVGGTIVGGVGRGSANASGLLASVQPTLNPKGGITTISGSLINPVTHQWNLNIERQMPWKLLFSAAYVGTRGEHLYVNQEFNPEVNFGARLNPAFGPITVRTNAGDSIYHALQLQVDRKFSKGLFLRGAYTFSKLIDDGSEVFTTTGGSSFAQNPFNQGGDRGLSAFDHRHVFTLSYVWDVPYVHDTSNMAMRAVNAVTRDWQASGIATYRTGSPQTVIAGFDVLGDGRGGNDRPNMGNPSAPFTSLGIDASQCGAFAPGAFLVTVADCGVTNTPVPASAFHFIIPAAGLGNLGRNTFESAGFDTWNMGIQRTFKFTERHSLSIRGEFFNAFNHVSTGIPSLNMLDPSFGDASITRFGGRQIRLFAKYAF